MDASAKIEREWPPYLKATLRQREELARIKKIQECGLRQ